MPLESVRHPNMKTLNELGEFTQAYIMAALWTNDEGAGSGQYEESGRIEELFPKIHPACLERVIAECAAFQAANADMLARAGTVSQNGHDFWLTRCGHGAGFWDRGYADDVDKALTDASHKAGNRDCSIDVDAVYIE